VTYLAAAYAILKSAGKPLHFEEITQRALAKDLIQPSDLTPDATEVGASANLIPRRTLCKAIA